MAQAWQVWKTCGYEVSAQCRRDCGRGLDCQLVAAWPGSFGRGGRRVVPRARVPRYWCCDCGAQRGAEAHHHGADTAHLDPHAGVILPGDHVVHSVADLVDL